MFDQIGYQICYLLILRFKNSGMTGIQGMLGLYLQGEKSNLMRHITYTDLR